MKLSGLFVIMIFSVNVCYATDFASDIDKLLLEGKISQAITLADQCQKQFPYKTDCYDKKHQALERDGRYKLAIKELDKLIEIEPSEAYYYYSRGYSATMLYKSYMNTVSEHKIDYGVKDKVSRIEAMLYLDDSVKYFSKAIELDNKSSIYFGSRGHSYIEKGLYEAAINDYLKERELLLISGKSDSSLKFSLDFNEKNINRAKSLSKANSTQIKSLLSACESGDVELLKLVLDQGIDPNSIDSNGRPALIVAAVKGHTKVVKMLLERGAKPNVKVCNPSESQSIDITEKDRIPFTPLVAASLNNHNDVIDLLLANGAALEFPQLSTPLHYIAMFGTKGNIKSFTHLLEKGANPNAKNLNGSTPMMILLTDWHNDGRAFDEDAFIMFSQALIKHGADINALSSSNTTVLDDAVNLKYNKFVKFLLENGAKFKKS